MFLCGTHYQLAAGRQFVFILTCRMTVYVAATGRLAYLLFAMRYRFLNIHHLLQFTTYQISLVCCYFYTILPVVSNEIETDSLNNSIDPSLLQTTEKQA